jgi:hypothetical protein
VRCPAGTPGCFAVARTAGGLSNRPRFQFRGARLPGTWGCPSIASCCASGPTAEQAPKGGTHVCIRPKPL